MATANLDFEEKLWQMATKLRGSMNPGEYKNVVLGLLFLKYVSDAFEEKYLELKEDEWADEEDRDEYAAENIFFVPQEARWSFIQANAKKPEIGQLIDKAMIAIEKENSSLVGVLPKTFASPDLDKTRLGETIDLFSFKVGDIESRHKDVLGRVYEYFLHKFASTDNGEFYTPSSVVRLIVEMLEPYKGRVYDPACGSGGMFVQSSKFIKEHQGRIDNLSVYGQEFNPATWKLCKMNLAIRGIDANLGAHHADTFLNDLHKGLKADYIMANPPFNIKDWGGDKLKDDVRWQYGIPPEGNANYAWIQHMISKLAPAGTAGFILANGSMSSNTGGEGEIRKKLIENDLVECIISLPGQLFYSTQIPVCIWFVSKSKAKTGKRERDQKILFIDARNEGHMADRTHKEFSGEDIQKIAKKFHAWRGTKEIEYADVDGFCKEATIEEVRENDHILTPGRYVGLAAEEDDSEPFEEKMTRLTTELSEQFAKSKELEEQIRKALGGIGYGI